MKRFYKHLVSVIYLEHKDLDIDTYIKEKQDFDSKNIMSVTGYTSMPIKYEKSKNHYAYLVTNKIYKCKKIDLSEERKRELQWLIDEENKNYGLV